MPSTLARRILIPIVKDVMFDAVRDDLEDA